VHYREIKPHPRLEPFVKCFWYMERDYSVPGAEEVVWPDGKTELLCLTGTASYENAGTVLPRSFLIGPLTRPLPLTAPGVVRLVGVRFLPWGFWPFSRKPVSALRDQVVPHVSGVGELPADDLSEAAAQLEGALLRRLDEEGVANHPLVAPLAQAIVEAEGALSAIDLERRAGVTTRHLERLFSEVVGLTPKKLSVILRFDKARRVLFWNPRADLTDVAHDLGYYDHSHFIRDFRALFGMTPSEFKEWTARQRASTRRPPQVGFLQEEPS
jgi:AraC-like DNA-binding protein